MIAAVSAFSRCQCLGALRVAPVKVHKEEERSWGEVVSFQGRHSRAEAACVPLSAAGSAVVLQRGFGKSLPSEVNRERLPVPALTDTQHSHRHFPCSTLSESPQTSLSPEATKLGLMQSSS